MRRDPVDIEGQLLERVARAICSHTDLRKSGDPDPIFDQPDDLVWVRLDELNHPVPRWLLYKPVAHAILGAISAPALASALALIINQVERGKGADKLVADRAFDEIFKLARDGLKAALGAETF